MKKNITLISIFVLVVIELFSQGFGTWALPPYRINFYGTGPVVNTDLVEPPEISYQCSAAGMDNNGNILFYIANTEVYEYEGSSEPIGYLNNSGYDLAHTEMEVINIPGQPDMFYVIWGQNSGGGYGNLQYTIIDCTGESPQVGQDFLIFECDEVSGFALTEVNNNVRYMYTCHKKLWGSTYTSGVDKYLINSNGISYVENITNVDINPILNYDENYWCHNIEINQSENTLAWLSGGNKIFIIHLDENGSYLSTSQIPFPGLSLVSGIEFSPINGDSYIYASYYLDETNNGIKKINYPTGSMSTLASSTGYGMTFLETASDGLIYGALSDFSASPSLGRINPSSDIFTPAVINSLNLIYKGVSPTVFVLPQNSTLYSSLNLELSMEPESCPGYADGTATAYPSGGTPPYSFLWSPGGQTTQTISNLSVGEYTCCVTDALEDTDCETIEVTYPPGLFDIETIILNSSTPYINWNKKIEKELVITGNDVTLIDCDVQFGKFGKIIVQQGAKLTLSNCKVSNLEECGSMWQGIEVWGVEWTHQYTIGGQNAQGQLILENNTIIENAVSAVELWRPPNYWSTTGGILQAKDAIFRNNAKSVHALLYHNIYLGQEKDNVTYLRNCSFEIDANYIADVDFYKHVDLHDVKGVKFYGCDFSVEDVPGVNQSRIGIASYSAGFHVLAPCISTHNPCDEYDNCTFNGFANAIYATNTLSTYTFSVNRAIFANNTYGIMASGVNFPTVLFSDFQIGQNTSDDEECEGEGEGKLAPAYGIHLTNCTGFSIEENKFSKYFPAPPDFYVGIHLNSCPSFSDDIYLNEFYGLSMGIVAEGYNRSNILSDLTGVSYICNKNYYNAFDYHVMNNSMIRGNVGTTTNPASNILTDPAISIVQFQNSYTQDIRYYYNSDEEAIDEWLVEYSDFVYPYPIDYENTCPSHFGGTGGGGGDTDRGIVLDPAQMAEEELMYYQSMNDLNSVQNLYESLKDGGNTEALQTEIETSWPDDMWELRADLLGKSPHLSKEVLMTASDKTNVLPESVIFEILSANPDELRDEELISYLENKEQPLPEYMIDILKQLGNGVTYKTILQNQMSDLYHNKVNAAKNMVRSELNDTVSDLTILRDWMDNIGGMIADKQIISSYVQEGDYVSAQSLLNMIPALYDLNVTELEDYNDFQTLTDLQIDLLMQNRNMSELDSVEFSTVQDIAENGTGRSKFDARGILEYFFGYHYCNCMNVPDSAALKTAAINFGDLQQSTGISIHTEPNPANTWVAINYSLPFDGSGAVIKIFDNTGKKIDEWVVADRQGQFIWDVRKIQPGIYIYKLECNGLSEKGKLIIK